MDVELSAIAAAQVAIIRAGSTLRPGREAAAPQSSPVALVIEPSLWDGSRFVAAAAGQLSLVFCEQSGALCGWAPRAQVTPLLNRVAPLEAVELRRLAATDVGRWAVVHAAAQTRALEFRPNGPFLREAEAFMLGPLYAGRCLNSSCAAGLDHDWDEREVRDDETGDVVDGTTCVRCGMPYDVYVGWSSMGF